MKVLAFLLCLLASPALAQTGSIKTPTVLTTEVNTLLADNTTNQITAFDFRQVFLDVITSAASLPSVNTFTSGQTITLPSGNSPALTINQTLTGTAGATNWNSITIASDNVAGSFLADMNVTHSFGGAAATGARVGQFNWLIQTAATSASNSSRNYLANECLSQTNTGDGGTGTGEATAKGAYFGCNALVRNAGTNVYNMFSMEFDLQSTSTSSARYSAAGAFVNFEAVQGTAVDAGALFYSGGSIPAAGGGGPYGPGVGFHTGILFGELGNSGLPPIDSGGSVLSTFFTSLSTFPVTNGIDLRGFTVSGLAFASTGFTVSGTGTVTVNKNANPASVSPGGVMQIALADGTSAPMIIDAFAGAPTFEGRRTGGTALSKVNVGSGDVLSQFVGQGWTTGAAYGVQSGSVAITAAETFTAIAQGTRIDVRTTPIGTIIPAVAATFAGDGSFKATGYAQHGVSTVAALPTCNSAAEGARYGVTDHAAAPVYAAIVAAGGTVHIGVYCNGTNWIND